MVWESFHFGGELAPRIDLNDTDGAAVDSMTFTDVAAEALNPLDNVAPKQEYDYPLEYELRTLIDGQRQPNIGGFYFESRLRFAILDLTAAGYVNSIINHCARPGHFCEFYPFSDNTDIHYRVFITGKLGDFDEYTRPLVIGMSATLEVYGLDPLPERPFNAPEGLICLDKGLPYPAIENLNSQCASKAIVYTAPEMEDDLGFSLNSDAAIVP